ncbi:hypothetical protein BDFB_005994, partial [Asbolus verrucosus]
RYSAHRSVTRNASTGLHARFALLQRPSEATSVHRCELDRYRIHAVLVSSVRLRWTSSARASAGGAPVIDQWNQCDTSTG